LNLGRIIAVAALAGAAAFSEGDARELLFSKTPYAGGNSGGSCKDDPSIYFRKYGDVTCAYAKSLKEAKGKNPCTKNKFKNSCPVTCGLCEPVTFDFPDVYDDPALYDMGSGP